MNPIISEALENFKQRIDHLACEFAENGLSPQEHSKFEHQLHGNLGELGRSVEKAVLEKADLDVEAVTYMGQKHYRKYKGPQEFECLFGKIEVVRTVYQANGERTICPLEIDGGITHHHMTPAAAECVAHSMARMTPSEITDYFKKWLYLDPCETVIKQVAGEIGEMTENLRASYEKEITEAEGPLPEDVRVVAFSRDGTCVNVREEGWREAMVGSVSFYGEEKASRNKDKEKDRRKRLRSVYVGQMPEEKAKTFNEKFESEIERTLEAVGDRDNVAFACIADGALSNWTIFEGHPELRNATHINDYYHAAEYLSKAAQALFGEGSEKAESWFKKYRRILKEDENGVEKVIRSIRYYRGIGGRRSKKRKEVIRRSLRYITRNRSRMNYVEYRRRGLPIGSGVIEGACKTVVGSRLKRAGMRWSISGGQSILNLRVLLLSGRWDPFWNCHQKVLELGKVAA